MKNVYFNTMIPEGSDADIFTSGYEEMSRRIAAAGLLVAHREHLLKYQPGRKIAGFAEYLRAKGECAALLDSDAA